MADVGSDSTILTRTTVGMIAGDVHIPIIYDQSWGSHYSCHNVRKWLARLCVNNVRSTAATFVVVVLKLHCSWLLLGEFVFAYKQEYESEQCSPDQAYRQRYPNCHKAVLA